MALVKKKSTPVSNGSKRTKAKRKPKPKPQPKKPNVDAWLEKEDTHKQEALEQGSREFDDADSLSVHTLEAVYGKESGFGEDLGSRGTTGAAGHFQMEKATAERMGLTVTTKNDQRFDIDEAVVAEAKYLKKLDGFFTEERNLGSGLETIPVTDLDERTKFVLAANNAGEGRIARAQALAKAAGKDPAKWDDVKEFLKAAGASDAKVKEITSYVDMTKDYENKFQQKSEASEEDKNKGPTEMKPDSGEGHWITTKNGKHILIDEPK
jgi:membrane-bound lytic murein transglycosylase MltF